MPYLRTGQHPWHGSHVYVKEKERTKEREEAWKGQHTQRMLGARPRAVTASTQCGQQPLRAIFARTWRDIGRRPDGGPTYVGCLGGVEGVRSIPPQRCIVLRRTSLGGPITTCYALQRCCNESRHPRIHHFDAARVSCDHPGGLRPPSQTSDWYRPSIGHATLVACSEILRCKLASASTAFLCRAGTHLPELVAKLALQVMA